MIACLTNRIGIRGCDAPFTEASASGVIPVVEALPILLVNDLPGVSLLNIDALMDDDDETFLDVWNKVVLRTLLKFEVLVKAKLNKCFTITDTTVVNCVICAKKDMFDVALWYLHGAELMIERTSTDALNRFTTIDLDKAERLKEDFYAEFITAVDDAVRSINPKDTDCITGCLEHVESISWKYASL